MVEKRIRRLHDDFKGICTDSYSFLFRRLAWHALEEAPASWVAEGSERGLPRLVGLLQMKAVSRQVFVETSLGFGVEEVQ